MSAMIVRERCMRGSPGEIDNPNGEATGTGGTEVYDLRMSWNPFRARREQRLAELDQWRVARRLANEDVTVLGEQLARLHVDTLAADLNEEARQHYRRALEHYDSCKQQVGDSTTREDILAVEQVLADARYHRAAVLALVAGEPLPERREPCWFDPRHGPSTRQMTWAPPSGVERQVPVCAADARRLEGGVNPDIRLVRIGDRYVPWHQAGGLAAVIETSRAQSVAQGGSAGARAAAEAYTRSGLGGGGGGGYGAMGGGGHGG